MEDSLPELSIQVQFRFALVTGDNTPENLVSAFGTEIAGFFVFHPLLRADTFSVGNRSQNDLFTNSHGKIVNVPAGKFLALVASFELFFLLL